MIQYVQPEVLSKLCSSEGLQSYEQSLGTLLVEVIASVLDNEVRVGRRRKGIEYVSQFLLPT